MAAVAAVPQHLHSKMRFAVVAVTRSMAEQWLARNLETNRKVRPSKVAAYRGAMERGEWKPTHQAIAISTDGWLIDGQHRLRALVESGLPYVYMGVVFDCDRATYDSLDIGVNRSYSDTFQLTADVMAPIAFIGKIVKAHLCTKQELAPFVAKFAAPMAELVALAEGKHQRRLTSSPVKVAALAAILSGEDKVYVHTVYSDLLKFNFADLPPIGREFLKQLSQSRKSGFQAAEGNNLLARSWYVFRSAHASSSRLIVKNPSYSADLIREVFRNALGVGE